MGTKPYSAQYTLYMYVERSVIWAAHAGLLTRCPSIKVRGGFGNRFLSDALTYKNGQREPRGALRYGMRAHERSPSKGKLQAHSTSRRMQSRIASLQYGGDAIKVLCVFLSNGNAYIEAHKQNNADFTTTHTYVHVQCNVHVHCTCRLARAMHVPA